MSDSPRRHLTGVDTPTAAGDSVRDRGEVAGVSAALDAKLAAFLSRYPRSARDAVLDGAYLDGDGNYRTTAGMLTLSGSADGSVPPAAEGTYDVDDDAY